MIFSHNSYPAPKLRTRAEILLLASAVALAGCSQTSAEVKPDTENEKYISHEVTATYYYVGEEATADNDYISNVPTAWSADGVKDFGGVDDPDGRDFEPLHNTYYFALPASEFDEDGPVEGAYDDAPWNPSTLHEGESLFKGRWIKVEKDGKEIYAQWHDVGPCADDQPECLVNYDYVFGTENPVNTFGEKAGLDLSPDAADALDLDGSATVTWEFVDEDDVPEGEWTEYPAITNKTNW